jgi:hypothetical protein
MDVMKIYILLPFIIYMIITITIEDYYGY